MSDTPLPEQGAELPSGCTIVMAHPDDEVLWASSILADAERVILCYGDFPGRPTFSAGRRQAVSDLPLRAVESLDVTEAATFEHAAWPEPEDIAEGLMPKPLPFKLHGVVLAAYRANFQALCRLLEERLAGVSDVVTHNPWGEYGHEDHVQVFRAVEHVSRRLGFRIWVTGYVAEKAVVLMQRHLRHFGPPTRPMQTDKDLSDQLRQIYIDNGCWTWSEDYVWPDREWFFPLRTDSDQARDWRPGMVQHVNINMLQIGWTCPSRTKQTLKNAARNVRDWGIARSPTTARLYEKLRH